MKGQRPTKVRVVEADGRAYIMSNTFPSRAEARAAIKGWKAAKLFDGCKLTTVPA